LWLLRKRKKAEVKKEALLKGGYAGIYRNGGQTIKETTCFGDQRDQALWRRQGAK